MKKHEFEPVSPQVNFPELEERVINYWKKHRIFEKSVSQKPETKTWNFVDGPPFITGLPHYGSLLSSIPKDLFPRYWTMKGYRVRRVWGWDCHGLPAENKVENKLGITRKKDIVEKVGVKKFIDECKLYVKDVSGEWEWYVDHVGRWVDFANAYKTMDKDYMETVMWVFKQMYEKNLIYKGLRVSLYCPHCATPISNFEVAMDADNYKQITESGATYKYQLVDEPDTYLLAWSTTPWNKLVTPALAVNPKLTYIKVKQGIENYILAQSTVKILRDEPYTVLEKFKGKTLLGKKFVPHYDFYKIDSGKKAFVLIDGDFVSAEEGTGIVTIAAYGEEDLAAMREHNVHIEMHLDEEGILKSYVPKWGGMYYLKVNKLVNQDLANRGLLYHDELYTHTVPTCWRCHTRLIYAPQNAWYVDIQSLKDRLKGTNEAVTWHPEHFKMGRYLKSLENAPDWCISRSRYWGSPVPVWDCECGERFVPGSIAELEKVSGKKIVDLHKPDIDEVTITCAGCGKKVRRVSEVLDSWIEAGSAPFAERHYPFEKNLQLEDFFPPDFIVEYTGQIRAWFYVLHVIATALFDSHAFENVVVTGVILGTDGRKMSKNYGNYPDPKEMIQKYGGDGLRLYLMGSPVMHGEDIRISEEDYRNHVRGSLLLLWNVYNFFVTNVISDQWQPEKDTTFVPKDALNKWILSLLNQHIRNVSEALEAYDSVLAIDHLNNFISLLSKWFIRRCRNRVGPAARDFDLRQETYMTMWVVLTHFTKLFAPVAPFISEEIYRNVTGAESVHLVDWPEVFSGYSNEKLERQMNLAMDLVSEIHNFRKKHEIKVRIPLKVLTYKGPEKIQPDVLPILLEEVNVYTLTYSGKATQFSVTGDAHVANQDVDAGVARDLVRQIQTLRKEKGLKLDERIKLILPKTYGKLPQELLADVKRKTLVESVVWGDRLSLLPG